MIPRTILPFSGMLWQTALMSTTSSVHPFAGKIFCCWIRWSIICLRLLPFPNTVCMPPLCRTMSGFSTIRVKSPGRAIICTMTWNLSGGTMQKKSPYYPALLEQTIKGMILGTNVITYISNIQKEHRQLTAIVDQYQTLLEKLS